MRKGFREGKKDEGIKKGPWKAEEDQVLLNHVDKHGPMDWSSIRSRGLLQRTGKSCRLRWVNKLRPNLKNGCKFSVEEERVVIESQAQIGNKWAKIATHLAGRTDNDVKNFWSSRQKRLARILHASTTPASKSHKKRRELLPVYHDDVVPSLEELDYTEHPKHFLFKEIPKFSCSSEGESSSQAASSSSPSNIRNLDSHEMVPFPDLLDSKSLGFEADLDQLAQLPLIPFAENQQLQTDIEFLSNTHELLKLDFDMFTTLDDELGKHLDIGPTLLEPVGNCGNVEGGKIDVVDPITQDFVFDDFPADMFDQVEPLPDIPAPSHD